MAITPLPTPAPSRDQPEAEFVANANALFGALPNLVTQINAESVAITDERELAEQAVLDAQAQVALAAAEVDQAEAFAVAAQNSALIASGAANYQGEYSAGTTYQIGETVSYSGAQFVAKTVNTGVTPVNGTNWLKIENGDVIGPASATINALAIFDGTTGKLLKSPINNGTAGQVLFSGGSGNIPSWGTLPSPSFNILFGNYTTPVFTVGLINTITFTATVTGAQVGNRVLLSPTSEINLRLTFYGIVTSSNTITIYIHNPSSGNVNNVSCSFYITVIQ